jgi:anti-sigma factor RsiW
VKPWFSGRVAFAPVVVDLTPQGFPLVGGRIDVIGTQPAPTLVYRHRQHLISLTAIPTPRAMAGALRPSRIEGYHLLNWSEDGVAYWATSDLAPSDLDAFARAFRAVAQAAE